jgi:two-component system response regulator HydG
MRAEDIRPHEIITRQGDWGFPLFASSRYLALGTRSLGRIQEELTALLGSEPSAGLMARHGYEAGLATATAMADQYDWDSEIELLKAGGVMLTILGLAHEDIQTLNYNREGRELNLAGQWKDTLEATQWLHQLGESTHPVCHITSGFASGFASAVWGRRVWVRETECRAQGHSCCRYEGRPLDQWDVSPGVDGPFSRGFSVAEEIEQLRTQLKKAWAEVKRHRAEVERLSQRAQMESLETQVVFRSPAMASVLAVAEKVAPTAATVLIRGESGTGKEVLARFIHRRSGREDQPFLAINCAALPPSLLESELFGHKKGAFTGADRDKKGLFFLAGTGTLFLDEIGDVPLPLQAKLLRAVQEREARPVGGTRDRPIRARILTATNRDLKTMVEAGEFRNDLYYRLAVFPIVIPPLRERRQDILVLARHFLARFAPDHPGFAPETIRLMESYAWPGNVRELLNAVEYASVLAGSDRIRPDHLPQNVTRDSDDPLIHLATDLPNQDELIRRYTHLVLHHTDNNKQQTARILGIDPSTLWRRLKEE